MSGGIRTSVKSYLISQRISMAQDTVHEIESANGNFTAAQAADTEEQTSLDLDSTNSYVFSRVFSCTLGCLSIQIASKSTVSNGTNIRAHCPPYREAPPPRTEVGILLKVFSFSELKTAAMDFRPDTMVGEGGFGRVYKGWIDKNSLAPVKPFKGMSVAIKRLNPNGFQGLDQGFREVHTLGQLHHPNLVKLIGYCSEDNEFLLVYEFLPLGSLDNHIFQRSSCFQPLSWTVRMKIALGAAKALAFLHSEAKIIVRDFKTSNILLDSLSDFGLAVDGRSLDRQPVAETRVEGTDRYAALGYIETRVMGTYGYAAPEYVKTGRLNTKCDVYGFGVVLLELLSGRPVLDWNRHQPSQDLVKWARPYRSKHRVLQIFDTRIKGHFSVTGALKAVDLAFLCLSIYPERRPNMNDVVKALEQLQESGDMDG